MENSLYQQRLQAALRSKGTSDGAIYDLVLSLAAKFCAHGRCLEFGSGTGLLIHRLREELHFEGEVTGADIMERPPELHQSVHWLQADLNAPLSVPAGTFDVVISTEVIEHLENPRAIFREFHRLLIPGGLVILTTPNQESLRSLLSLFYLGHFVAFLDSCYPAHITALLRRDFDRICTETGFELPQFFYTNHGGIPKLPSIEWQQLGRRLFKGRWFSDNVALVTRKK